MQAFQGKITTEGGIITGLEHGSGEVEIVAGSKSEIFTGAFAFPGLVDSHCHLTGLGIKLLGIDLAGAASIEECLELAKRKLFYQGAWITGRGWNDTLWKDGASPHKRFLDSIYPGAPVCFDRVDGHACWVNSEALKIAGISSDTPDPMGGIIVKEDNDAPTGVLIDNAMQLVYRHLPRFSQPQAKEMLSAACAELLKYGITEVHDMDVWPYLMDVFLELDNTGKLPIRVNSYLQAQAGQYEEYGLKPYAGNFLEIKGIKFYADGAVGSRGAAMSKEYADSPGNKGLLLLKKNEIISRIKKGVSSGFDVAIHAIGDEANDFTLRIYAECIEKQFANSDTVLRIEHAQHIRPGSLRYFEKYGFPAAVQPVHLPGDVKMVRKRLAGLDAIHYPWKSLLKAGAMISGGSDFPVETHNPFKGIEAFVKRIPANESEPWIPEERLSLDEALNAYIKWPRVISKNDNQRGALKEGMQADIAVLNNSLSDTGSLDKTAALAVYVGGAKKYGRS